MTDAERALLLACAKLLDNMKPEPDPEAGLFPIVLCGGCGPVQVDHTGRHVHEPASTH